MSVGNVHIRVALCASFIKGVPCFKNIFQVFFFLCFHFQLNQPKGSFPTHPTEAQKYADGWMDRWMLSSFILRGIWCPVASTGIVSITDCGVMWISLSNTYVLMISNINESIEYLFTLFSLPLVLQTEASPRTGGTREISVF